MMSLSACWRSGLAFLVIASLAWGATPGADGGKDADKERDLEKVGACLEEYGKLLDGAIAVLARDEGGSSKKLSKAGQDLLLFCESGRLVSRGLANSPFVGTTDAWIVRQALHDEAFGKLIGATPDQRRKTTLEDARYFAQPTTKDAEENALTVRDGAPGWGYHRWLKDHLTAEQQQKLPQFYLRVEGLTALRRPIFRDLIGIALEEQKAIARFVDEYERKNVTGHQVIFFMALDNDERFRLPIIELILRWQSANVDLKILATLDGPQREKLHRLLEKGTAYRNIQGPGAFPVALDGTRSPDGKAVRNHVVPRQTPRRWRRR